MVHENEDHSYSPEGLIGGTSVEILSDTLLEGCWCVKSLGRRFKRNGIKLHQHTPETVFGFTCEQRCLILVWPSIYLLKRGAYPPRVTTRTGIDQGGQSGEFCTKWRASLTVRAFLANISCIKQDGPEW